jgi:hypothetical protein
VNELSLHGLSPEAARAIPIPQWWVTDHFGNTASDEPIEVGSIVRSADEGIPVKFEAVAKLSYW